MLQQPSDDETIYNYRLSRARRCVENAFGILSSKWLCLSRSMFCKPDRAQKIVSACTLLHNFLLKKAPAKYYSESLVDRYDCNGVLKEGSWRRRGMNIFHPLQKSKTLTDSERGKTIRDILKDYFICPEGKLSWQDKSVFKNK